MSKRSRPPSPVTGGKQLSVHVLYGNAETEVQAWMNETYDMFKKLNDQVSLDKITPYMQMKARNEKNSKQQLLQYMRRFEEQEVDKKEMLLKIQSLERENTELRRKKLDVNGLKEENTRLKKHIEDCAKKRMSALTVEFNQALSDMRSVGIDFPVPVI
jgi:predicted  nucleic acid-binding Zn-ribbon protein